MNELTWRQRNEYELLEVTPDASEEDIKAAFRLQSKVWHPDRFSDPHLVAEANDRMTALSKAYEALNDPLARRRIDRTVGFAQVDTNWLVVAAQSDPETWKRMAAWMKDEDVGSGFDRRMAFAAGDLLERGRRPTDKQLPYLLTAWETAVGAGFDPDG